jgi:hypothetical protein
MLFPVVDRFQSGWIPRRAARPASQAVAGGPAQGFERPDLRLHAGKQTAGGEEPGEGHAEDADGVDSGVRDGLAVGDLLCGFAAADGGAGCGFPLADSMRTVTVTMKVEAKEEIKTPAGTFQTVRVQPTAEEGIVKNRGNIWIWYTDDARHMPVQIRARLFWGTITFHLQSVEAK